MLMLLLEGELSTNRIFFFFFFLLVSPTDIRMFLSLDALGVAHERHCASNVEPD